MKITMYHVLFEQINEQFIPATNSCLACTCKSKQEGGLFCENLSMNCTEECGPDEELVYKNGSCCPTCEKQRSGNSCKTSEKYKYIEVEEKRMTMASKQVKLSSTAIITS